MAIKGLLLVAKIYSSLEKPHIPTQENHMFMWFFFLAGVLECNQDKKMRIPTCQVYDGRCTKMPKEKKNEKCTHIQEIPGDVYADQVGPSTAARNSRASHGTGKQDLIGSEFI
jgi:hypothetical protein